MSTRWDDELTDLVTSRGRALVGYGYALTGDLRRAEDLVQDALVRVFRRFRRPEAAGTEGHTEFPLHDGGSHAGIEAYVRRTMLNLYLDETRRFALWRKAQPKVAVIDQVKAPASDISARADVTLALANLSYYAPDEGAAEGPWDLEALTQATNACAAETEGSEEDFPVVHTHLREGGTYDVYAVMPVFGEDDVWLPVSAPVRVTLADGSGQAR